LAKALGNRLELIDLVSGQVVADLRLPPIAWPDVPVFSGDSRRVTLRSIGGIEIDGPSTVVVVDVRQGKALCKVAAPQHTLALSPDGKLLATASGKAGERSAPVVLWDVDTGKQVRQLAFAGKGILGVVFSPDGRQLTVLREDGLASFWDVATGKFVKDLQTWASRGIRELRYSPDGKLSFFSWTGSLRTWDVATGESRVCPLLGADQLIDCTTRKDGTMLALGTAGNSVCIWEPFSGKILTPLGVHGSYVSSLLFSKDGRSLLSSGADGIRQWDLSGLNRAGRTIGKASSKHFPAPRERIQEQRGPCQIFFSPGNPPFPTPPSQVAELGALEWRGPQLECDWNPDGYRSRTFSSFTRAGQPGLLLGVANNGTDFVSVDLRNGELKGRFSERQDQSSEPLTVSGDGRYFALLKSMLRGGNRSGCELVVRDQFAGKEILRHAWEKNIPGSVLFSPDGRLLLLALQGTSKVEVWDVSQRCWLKPLEAELLPEVPFLWVSPDHRLLVAGTQTEGKRDGRLVVWEMATGSVRQIFQSRQRITSLAFSWDSQILASGGMEGSVLLWDLPGRLGPSGQGKQLTEQQATELWERLGSADASKAFPIIAHMTRNPSVALPFFQEKVAPSGAKKTIQADELLFRTTDPTILHQVRAVEVLERVGTAAARELLRTWAGGQPGTRLTREAEWALRRLP